MTDPIEQAARVLVANRFHLTHETWEWLPQGTRDRYLHDARTLAAAGLLAMPSAEPDDRALRAGWEAPSWTRYASRGTSSTPVCGTCRSRQQSADGRTT